MNIVTVNLVFSFSFSLSLSLSLLQDLRGKLVLDYAHSTTLLFSLFIAIPEAKWIGLKTKDLQSLQLPPQAYQAMTDKDVQRLRSLKMHHPLVQVNNNK
jgi:hypothetical protein